MTELLEALEALQNAVENAERRSKAKILAQIAAAMAPGLPGGFPIPIGMSGNWWEGAYENHIDNVMTDNQIAMWSGALQTASVENEWSA